MKKLLQSFGYAWKGIKTAFVSERNMKIHVFISVLVIVMGFVLQISMTEWLFCILCMGLVFCAELFNTAIETLTDRFSPDKDPLAGRTKDLSAGAVLLSAIISVIIGVIIFLPKIIALLK